MGEVKGENVRNYAAGAMGGKSCLNSQRTLSVEFDEENDADLTDL